MDYRFSSVQSSCSYVCAWRHNAALRDKDLTKQRLAQSRSTCHGQRWQRISRPLCRTVCTVSLLFLETKCHARWVCSYMQPSPMRSCPSISCTLACQSTGSTSTCYFSRMIGADTYGLCRVARLMLQLLSTH
jgi:hypothetical protein